MPKSWFWKTLVLLTAFGYLKYFYLLFNKNLAMFIYGYSPNWFPYWSILVLLNGIPTSIGLWFGRKWSVFTYTLSVIAGSIFVIFVYQIPWWGQVFYFVSNALMFLAIYQQRKYYNLF